MNENNTSTYSYKVVTPLNVIMAFIALTEVMAGIAIINTQGVNQLLLVIFLIVFPILIASSYFFILFKKPYVLYSPFEYKSADDIERFINTLRNTTDDAKSSFQEIEKLRLEIENQAITISNITADGQRMLSDIEILHVQLEKQKKSLSDELETHKKEVSAEMHSAALLF